MSRQLTITFLALTMGVATVLPAAASDDQVCDGLDSGKVDVTEDVTSITITADEGQVITGYCVKAGSAYAGDGPYYVTDLSETAVTIVHPSGKEISHYSVSYGPAEVPDEPTEPGEVIVPGETVVIPGETVVVPGPTVVVPGPTQVVPRAMPARVLVAQPTFTG